MDAAEPTTKRCPKCELWLDRGLFARNAKCIDGLKCWCKPCANADNRARHNAKTDEEKQAYVDRGQAWREANREKCRGYIQAYYRRNPEKIKASKKEWNAANPEKRRAWARSCAAERKGASGKYDLADLTDIFRLQGGKCAYCRKSLKNGYHADHILPIKLGGTNDRQNIQLTCQFCNCSKKAKHPLDYARLLGRLL